MVTTIYSVDVTDLLGTPWAEMDCAAIALTAMHRCQVPVPAYALTRFGVDDAALAEFMASRGEHWRDVEAADALGDLIVSVNADLSPHVAVLVQIRPAKVVSTSKATGCSVLPLERIARVQKVLRWIP